jgi:DNA polymerase elongation subunit (family B)
MSIKINSNNKLVRNSTSIDLEWLPYKGIYSHDKTRLTAAAFCTNQGTRIVLHISLFEKYPNPERQLIRAIIRYLDKFDLIFGWYTTGVAMYDEKTGDYLDGRDSDFFILDRRCEFHNIPSPIAYSQSGSSTFLYDRSRKHIDLCKVYGKEIIQKGVFNDKYRTLQLDEVGQALLGVGKFKDSNSNAITGDNAHLLPVDEQINYVKRDAEITMLLACYNNCMVLRIMEFIALYSEIDYIITCHTGITKWYANIYDKMIKRDECTLQSSEHKIPKQEIGGGNSIEPKRGFYKDQPIDELDVKGMYPTIAIEHNISFETVNCRCCQDNPNARIPSEVMDEINERLQKKGLPNRIEPYWICQQRNGAFPTKLWKLIKERECYQQLVNQELAKPKDQQQLELINYYEARQLALKLLANAGYGAFARNEFDYSDYRVSEIITGYGRLIHKQMEKMGFEHYGFQTVFGFTDSIFIRNGTASAAAANTPTTESSNQYISKFLEDCQNQLNIKLEHKNRFMFTIIFDKKNRYIAWTGSSADKPILKNLDGMSRKYPTWIKQQIEKIATCLITKPYDNVIPIIREAFEDLDYGRFEARDMQFTEQLDKDPNQYTNDKDIRVKVLGLELGARKGELVYWYESLANKRGYSTKIKDLSIKKYKEILWDKVKDMLDITNYNIAKIKQDLLYENENIIITGNSRK